MRDMMSLTSPCGDTLNVTHPYVQDTWNDQSNLADNQHTIYFTSTLPYPLEPLLPKVSPSLSPSNAIVRCEPHELYELYELYEPHEPHS